MRDQQLAHAMQPLFVSGPRPVRIYLTHQRLLELLGDLEDQMIHTRSARTRRFYGVPITEDFTGQGDRIVLADGGVYFVDFGPDAPTESPES